MLMFQKSSLWWDFVDWEAVDLDLGQVVSDWVSHISLDNAWANSAKNQEEHTSATRRFNPHHTSATRRFNLTIRQPHVGLTLTIRWHT
jgi:hypothetical protein